MSATLAMREQGAKEFALTTLTFAACAAMCIATWAAIGHAQALIAAPVPPAATYRLPLVLVQNPTTLFTLPEMSEPTISPINPGTLPGTTSAIGGSTTGTNPVTGLPCNGSGSISVSGVGGLPGTATPPPQDSTETLDQIPVGTPPVNSIYGSQNNLGSC